MDAALNCTAVDFCTEAASQKTCFVMPFLLYVLFLSRHRGPRIFTRRIAPIQGLLRGQSSSELSHAKEQPPSRTSTVLSVFLPIATSVCLLVHIH